MKLGEVYKKLESMGIKDGTSVVGPGGDVYRYSGFDFIMNQMWVESAEDGKGVPCTEFFEGWKKVL